MNHVWFWNGSFHLYTPASNMHGNFRKRFSCHRFTPTNTMGWLMFNEFLAWSNHNSTVHTTCAWMIGILRRLDGTIRPSAMEKIYTAVILPHIHYACTVWCLGHTKCLNAHGDLGRTQSVLGRWCDGGGVSSLFRSPATLYRNNSVTVTPVHFSFCYNKPEVESFRSRVRLSKSSKNWPRNENFCVIVSEVGWLSLKWYGGENVYNRDRQRPDSLANTDRRSPNRKKAK